MIVNKKGKYRFLRDYVDRNPISISTISKGTVVNITQIDNRYHKVISNSFSDWHNWDLPVEPVPEELGESQKQQPTQQSFQSLCDAEDCIYKEVPCEGCRGAETDYKWYKNGRD